MTISGAVLRVATRSCIPQAMEDARIFKGVWDAIGGDQGLSEMVHCWCQVVEYGNETGCTVKAALRLIDRMSRSAEENTVNLVFRGEHWVLEQHGQDLRLVNLSKSEDVEIPRDLKDAINWLVTMARRAHASANAKSPAFPHRATPPAPSGTPSAKPRLDPARG